MKKSILIFIIIVTSYNIFSQSKNENGYYRIRINKPYQDKVYMKTKNKVKVLKKGTVVEEKYGSVKVLRTLETDEQIIYKDYEPVKTTFNWKIGEIEHKNSEPDKLYLNPYHFKKADKYNKNYIVIPENGYVRLVRIYRSWKGITIPFAIRPRITKNNKTIGSKITTGLKLGVSYAFNYDWVTFKNRRLRADKSIAGISIALGGGFSKVSLDKNSTSLLDKPYENSEDGLAFFIAPGVGLNLKGFQINLSYGWDIALTNNVKDWDYNHQGFLGLGVGISTSSLF